MEYTVGQEGKQRYFPPARFRLCIIFLLLQILFSSDKVLSSEKIKILPGTPSQQKNESGGEKNASIEMFSNDMYLQQTGTVFQRRYPGDRKYR